MSYPEYTKKFRPKGTIIKKSHGCYYAYYATSKRVPGKKYPVQVIKGLAGKVDEDGFHPLTRSIVCFLQALFGEYCRPKMENVATPFWRILQTYLPNPGNR